MSLKLTVQYSSVVNFALQQNHVRPIRQISVLNEGEETLEDLTVQIESVPAFISPLSLYIQSIDPRRQENLFPTSLECDAPYLSTVTEKISGYISVKVLRGKKENVEGESYFQRGEVGLPSPEEGQPVQEQPSGAPSQEVLCEERYSVEVLPFDFWQGTRVLPEMLGAFVTPNHPLLRPIIKRAAEILGKWTGSSALDAYQSRDPGRVKYMMGAVFEAIGELEVNYCVSPASYEKGGGQRIRLVDGILDSKMACCLDVACLYAGCLEAIGLNPIIVIENAHAYSGAWLEMDSFASMVNDDASVLAKRMAEGINEILLVETTGMTGGCRCSFDKATDVSRTHIFSGEEFMLSLDIHRCRISGINPLPLTVQGTLDLEEAARMEALRHAAPTELSAKDLINPASTGEVTKQMIWERKLLDLSLRNNLLNTRVSKDSVRILSFELGSLEDDLADGVEFSLCGLPDFVEEGESVHLKNITRGDKLWVFSSEEQKMHRLHSLLSVDVLKTSLTKLYRASRTSMEENGANTLYLALGMLRWYETDACAKAHYAPVLLFPVEILRKSSESGYVLRGRDEDMMMNITLLEMLRQFFNIDIGGLNPLPRDASGVDVPLIFNTIRHQIMGMKGWDIEDQTLLGIFSFNKFVMWNDIHNNSEVLARNPVVRSLIDGRISEEIPLSDEQQTTLEDPATADYPGQDRLDKMLSEGRITLPISADSSQLEAIEAASRGESFILHGPPGTGKSQTITNMIANALYQGKRVLFVAEKMAALEVVQKRLAAIGLDPFCLELHSNKSKKSAVLEQLRRTSEVTRTKTPELFGRDAAALRTLIGQLSGTMAAIHMKHPAGLSLYDCMSEYALLGEGKEYLLDCAKYTQEDVSRMQDEVSEYRAACRIIGDPATDPLRDLRILGIPAPDAVPSMKDCSGKARSLSTLARETFTALFGGSAPTASKDNLPHLYEIASQLLEGAPLPLMALTMDIPEVERKVTGVCEAGARLDELQGPILKRYDRSILRADSSMLKAQYQEVAAKKGLGRLFAEGSFRSQFKQYSLSGSKPSMNEIQVLVDMLCEARTCRRTVEAYSGQMASLFPTLWNDGNPSSWDAMPPLLGSVGTLSSAIRSLSGSPEEFRALCSSLTSKAGPSSIGEFLSWNRDTLEAYRRGYRDFVQSLSKVESSLGISLEDNRGEREQSGEDFPQSLSSTLDRWGANSFHFRERAMYNTYRAALDRDSLSVLYEEVEAGRLQPSELPDVFRRSLFRSYGDFIVASSPLLTTFHGEIFQQKIERFRELSSEFETLTRKEIYAKLASTLPSLQKEASQSSEVGILQRNIRNGCRGISLRHLFEQIPDLLPRMCPCMMMSPLSVAQYIDASRPPFDLVIFDEASQMPTCEAVGAIARGRSIIVVGDPRQMPPTSFFTSTYYDEENSQKEDLESILDDCLALSLPSKRLLWHYRSRHESLIAFSNVKYYENSLRTFPSPDDRQTKVEFVHVNGLYDRGATRQNRAEAEAVVKEIEERLLDPEKRKFSMGVVTFNTNQQSLIEDLLVDLYRRRPHLEKLAGECPEPIFIKNLENVQGDERDIILFSVGYGQDKKGVVSLNFGPLNREGGWRRLNVAVSRARYGMKVFSTLTSDMIDLDRCSAEGVAGLKAFLAYAERGRDALLYDTASSRKIRDGVVLDIASAISSLGYEVKTNVGCSGYRVDIAVVDPKQTDRYFAAVLVDGYNFSSQRTARDREIVQVGVLGSLGWDVFRVWSLDWRNYPDKVLSDLKFSLDGSLAALHEKEEAARLPLEVEGFGMLPQDGGSGETDSETQAPAPLGSTPTGQDGPLPLFEHKEKRLPLEDNDELDSVKEPSPVDLGGEPDEDGGEIPYIVYRTNRSSPAPDLSSESFYGKLLPEIQGIIMVEGPISSLLLARRVCEVFSIPKATTRLSRLMQVALATIPVAKTVTPSGRVFFWPSGMDPATYNLYRTSSEREALDIAPEEVRGVLCSLLKDELSIPEEDAPKALSVRFGYARISPNVIKSMEEGIGLALSEGKVERRDGRLYLVTGGE